MNECIIVLWFTMEHIIVGADDEGVPVLSHLRVLLSLAYS